MPVMEPRSAGPERSSKRGSWQIAREESLSGWPVHRPRGQSRVGLARSGSNCPSTTEHACRGLGKIRQWWLRRGRPSHAPSRAGPRLQRPRSCVAEPAVQSGVRRIPALHGCAHPLVPRPRHRHQCRERCRRAASTYRSRARRKCRRVALVRRSRGHQ